MEKRFNPELAEILSIAAHAACGGNVKHDIGIILAQAVYEWYAKERDSDEIDNS